MSPSTPIYIIIRHDYSHHEDEVGREHFQAAYTTLKAANKRAKRIFREAIVEEDHNDMAEIEEERKMEESM